jgi:hypothetical protein
MFQRLFIAGIVFFWMLMTGALMQLWVNPATSEILSVPVVHVARQLFLHEQPSNLAVFQTGRRIGSLTLQPRRFDANGIGVVDFTGNILVALPFMAEQAFSWRGTVEMNRSFALQKLKLHIDALGPKITTELDIDPIANRATYTLQQEGEEPVENSLTLDQKGMEAGLEALGIDPSIFKQITLSAKSAADSNGPITFTARQSETQIQGERVQTYRVSGKQSTSPMIEADISHFGQILGVKTIFGFTFSPDT